MKRTMVYVDGGNLYYGLARPAKVKWLDLMALAKHLLSDEHEIVGIVYFASRVIDKSPTTISPRARTSILTRCGTGR